VLVVLALALLAGQPVERLVDIRVQGNTLTAEADIVRMAGVQPGAEVTAQTPDEVAARVRAGGRFERVEVLKRYASIADPSQIVLVIVVDEGRVVVRRERDGQARAVRRRGPPLMYLPILGSDEGYGFTYGALVTAQPVFGPGTRLSVPVTWGGERRVGIEVEKRREGRRITRVRGGGTLLSRRNPAFDARDTRQQLWVRGEREIVRELRAGVWSGIDFVSFRGDDTRVTRLGADVTLDTRVDPMLSRNAVYVRAAVERLGVRDGTAPVRTLLDATTYLGGPGQSLFVLRVYRDGASRAVPAYMKVLLGRDVTLRGFPPGSGAGDTTAAGTVEWRLPLTSPLSLGRLGVRAFVDAATVYDAGASLADQRFERGIGGGVWFSATVFRIALDVARGSRGTTRAQVSSGLIF
jgi:outer membrane protein assembly factor BamA